MSIILIIFNHAWLSWCSNDISTVLDKYIPVKKEGDEDQEDLGGRSFLNILSVLAGRNSLGLARWFQSSSSWKPCLDMTIMMVMPGHDNHDYHDSHDNFPFSQLWPGTSGPGGKHKWFRRVGSGIDIDMMDTDICLIFMLPCFFRTFGNPTDPNCAQQNHNPLIQLSSIRWDLKGDVKM